MAYKPRPSGGKLHGFGATCLLMLLTGCFDTELGGPCDGERDCESGLRCHQGICTVGCSDDPCEEGVCIRIEDGLRVCAAACSNEDDCRDGQVCRAAAGCWVKP